MDITRKLIVALSVLGALSGCGGSTESSTTSGSSQTSSPPPTTNAPSVNFSANPTTVSSGNASRLTWSSTNATSCTGSGGWSGSKTASTTPTSEDTASLSATTTFTLTCTGPGGNSARSVTVSVITNTGTIYEELFNDDVNEYIARKITPNSGASYQRQSSGGWDGSGWGRFTPATAADGYASMTGLFFGAPSPSPRSVIHVRFLYYISSSLPANEPTAKMLIITRQNGISGSRVMMHGYEDPARAGTWRIFSDNNINGDFGPSPAPGQDPWFNTAGYEDQWVCFELGINIAQNYRRLWVTTRDGVYNQRLVQDTKLATLLDYDTQTGDFTAGANVTGATSGATAYILENFDNGTSGSLLLNRISGEFVAGETLHDDRSGSATVARAMYPRFTQPFEYLDVLGQYSNMDGSTVPPGGPAPYFGIDDVVISDSGYIGPPVGFVR